MEKRGRVGAGEVMEPLYVCVYVPEFAAQAMMRLRPELQRAAVAVMTGEPLRRNEIAGPLAVSPSVVPAGSPLVG